MQQLQQSRSTPQNLKEYGEVTIVQLQCGQNTSGYMQPRWFLMQWMASLTFFTILSLSESPSLGVG